jgi:Polyketide cyclase / dehydrase and lipid transport
MHAHLNAPPATTVTSAPLRNRLRVHLNQPVEAVWSLVGDPGRLPEYSAGLERVDCRTDPASGACTEYTCHFKPRAAGEEGIVDRNVVRWYEPRVGYASTARAQNALGITDDLNLVIVEPSGGGTIVTWEEYYEAADLPMIRAEYDDAFADIAERLIVHFGGHVIERTVDGPRPVA